MECGELLDGFFLEFMLFFFYSGKYRTDRIISWHLIGTIVNPRNEWGKSARKSECKDSKPEERKKRLSRARARNLRFDEHNNTTRKNKRNKSSIKCKKRITILGYESDKDSERKAIDYYMGWKCHKYRHCLCRNACHNQIYRDKQYIKKYRHRRNLRDCGTPMRIDIGEYLTKNHIVEDIANRECNKSNECE